MGRALAAAVERTPGLRLAGGTVRPGKLPAPREGVFDTLEAALASAEPQVVIDFTSPEASVIHARLCAEAGVPMVIGSTGFSVSQRSELKALAHRTALVVAANTSVGVTLMVQVAGLLAKALGEGFDVEIVEAHHRLKKDAPSGTALRLAEELASALDRNSGHFTYARQGQVGPRPAGEIGIQTVRGGDVVGDHTVFFLGDGERLELTHRATSRETFALGAVRAAQWVVAQPPGQYDMRQVLGL